MRKLAIFIFATSLFNVGINVIPALVSDEPVRSWGVVVVFLTLPFMYAGRLFRSKEPRGARDPDATVTFRRPLVEYLSEILGSAALLAAGVLFFIEARAIGDFSLSGPFMAAIGLLAVIAMVMRGRSELRISPAGLAVKGLQSGTIPWDSIASIDTNQSIRMFDMGTVTLALRKTAAWAPKPQRRIPIIHPAKIDPDGGRITLYSDFFGADLSALSAALSARQQLYAF
jgi:hypothetical protein